MLVPADCGCMPTCWLSSYTSLLAVWIGCKFTCACFSDSFWASYIPDDTATRTLCFRYVLPNLMLLQIAEILPRYCALLCRFRCVRDCCCLSRHSLFVAMIDKWCCSNFVSFLMLCKTTKYLSLQILCMFDCYIQPLIDGQAECAVNSWTVLA